MTPGIFSWYGFRLPIADRHWNIGEGVIDWDGFADAFPPSCRNGCLSLEVYPKNENITEGEHLNAAHAGFIALRNRIIHRDN